jgi:NAD(P)-dependent dehydrogenase (short-subunit alcohol dehydrogenase family)
MKDKAIIISGGSEGIGFGMATHLAKLGARIVIASRDAEKGEAAASRIADLAGCDATNVAYVSADIGSEPDNQNMVAFTVDRFGRLDGAINNAVHPGDFKLLADEPVETFEQLMRTNVTGTFLGMKHQIRQFLAQGAKAGDNYSIVNISSGATRDIAPAMSAYVASKRAVEGLTEAAALEYSCHGIRINTLLFGVFETDKTRALHEAMPHVRDKNAAKHHVGRLGDPQQDAGAAAEYLLSERSGFVTGSTMFIDGGMCL